MARPAANLTPTESAALLVAARLVAADADTRATYLPGRQGAALDRAVSKLAAAQGPEFVPCVRPEPHPAHGHSGLRKGVAVHGRCPGQPAADRIALADRRRADYEAHFDGCADCHGHPDGMCVRATELHASWQDAQHAATANR